MVTGRPGRPVASVQRQPEDGAGPAPQQPGPLLEEIAELLAPEDPATEAALDGEGDGEATGGEADTEATAGEADLGAELEAVADQLSTSTDAIAAALPSPQSGGRGGAGEVEGGGAPATASSAEPPAAVQRAKGEKTSMHDRNWRTRVKALGNPQKIAGGIDKTKKAKYKAAKVLADALDRNDHSKLRYKPFKKKKTGAVHPVFEMLKEARKLNGLLAELGMQKEHLRYYQRKDLQGRRMKALLVAGDNMIGSNTGSTDEAYYGVPQFNARKNSSGSALWIKGHLLNDHLGGSGRSYNLVPLTAEKVSGGGKTGSNDANGIHNKQVEEPLKRVTERADYATLKYTVESIPPADRGGARAQTAEVRKYADAFQAEASKAVHAGSKAVAIRNAVKISHPTLAAIAQPLHTATSTTASTPANAAAKLIKNAELWELEDQLAPHGIKCSAYFTTTTGGPFVPQTADGSPMTDYKVVNKLPTKYTAPFLP